MEKEYGLMRMVIKGDCKRMGRGNMKENGKMVNQMEEEYGLMRKGIRNMKVSGRMVIIM